MKQREIFIQALQKQDADRAEFVRLACGDDLELRQSVEQLLIEYQRDDSFFLDTDPPDLVATLDAPKIAEGPNDTIGPYRLLEQIGEGGMGIVFVARQAKPIQRKVALKIIKPGMDTRQVVKRFESERQSLALMNHPNIAKVLDGGSTDSGRPYFVMELIHGLPITDYCDQTRMLTRERLELFKTVCDAVQHAHQKGIIHRDLKPSNILVTEIDGKPIPKVIDFGVAKATGQQLADYSIYTQFAQMVGTPLYMSPEQAGLRGADIDTRSDVYSLGVVLCELICGETPFDRVEMAAMTYEEIRRIVREVDPPRPSKRFSTLNAARGTTISQQRGLSDPKRLHQLIQGELDWIVMTALDKDRSRRYQSAGELAQDIERYLTDEPVQACPPSTMYRLRKTAKRYRGTLTATLLVFLTLIVGMGVATWQAVVANREKARAERAEQKAETESAIAKAIAEFLQDDLLGKIDPAETPDPTVSLRTVLDRAAAEIDGKFPDEPLVEAQIRNTIGKAYSSLGLSRLAEPHQRQAVRLATETLGAKHETTLDFARSLGESISDSGRFLEAEALLSATLDGQRQLLGDEHDSTIQTMFAYGHLQLALGHYEQADSWLRKVFELRRRSLGEEHHDTLRSRKAIATVIMRQGRYSEAATLLENVLDQEMKVFGQTDLQVAVTRNNLALVYYKQGHIDKAERLNAEALEQNERMRGPDHPSTLMNRLNAGIYALTSGKPDADVAILLRLLERCTNTLGAEHPLTIDGMSNLAAAYSEIGRLQESEELYRKTLALKERVFGLEHPSTLNSMTNLAMTYRYQERFDEAEDLLSRSLRTRIQVAGEDHPDTNHEKQKLADLYMHQGRHADAMTLYREIIPHFERVYGSTGSQTTDPMNQLGIAYFESGDLPEAIKLFQETLARRIEHRGKEHVDVTRLMQNLAWAYRHAERYGEAYKLYGEALAINRRIMEPNEFDLTRTLNDFSILLLNTGDHEEAYQRMQECLRIRRETLGDEHAETKAARQNLAIICSLTSRFEEAETHRLELLRLAREKFRDDDHQETLGAIRELRDHYVKWARHLVDNANPHEADIALAVELARKAVDVRSTPTAWSCLAETLYRQKDFAASRDAIEQACRLEGDKAAYHYPLRAMCLWQLGDKSAAHACYQEFVEWFRAETTPDEPRASARRLAQEMESLLGIADKERVVERP